MQRDRWLKMQLNPKLSLTIIWAATFLRWNVFVNRSLFQGIDPSSVGHTYNATIMAPGTMHSIHVECSFEKQVNTFLVVNKKVKKNFLLSQFSMTIYLSRIGPRRWASRRSPTASVSYSQVTLYATLRYICVFVGAALHWQGTH